MSGGIRIRDLEVPPLANTEQALEWGRGLTDRQRDTLLAAHKAMELAALNARHLQDRADFATTAQLWREAAEAKPAPVAISETVSIAAWLLLFVKYFVVLTAIGISSIIILTEVAR